MIQNNYMSLEIPSISENELFARVAVSAFISKLDPTIEVLNDIKTAVSEAVTNAIIHAYEEEIGIIKIKVTIEENTVTIIIEDFGKGIEDIEKAKEPLYTSKPELERSGMGFTIMENFMDKMEIISRVDAGTKVILTKSIPNW